MAPYPLPEEDVKWPPTLPPPVEVGPAPGDPTAFGEILPEVLPSLPQAGEQLLPDLLISPHMLPCKDPPGGWAGETSVWGLRGSLQGG